MDVTFSNVLEGTRQYFMGLPKQAQGESPSQPVWPAGAPPPEEGATAQSGAPTPSSRPPSTAASAPIAPPPRPPSEPLEPEPHIIHKATVMREAAEKRRVQPDLEDDDDPADALSPPTHIIHRSATRALPSPAPAPAAPCPSPARPPSAAPTQLPPPASETQPEASQYRPTLHRVQTPTARPPDHFAPGRPPDPYSASRPPESYQRYHYENLPDSARNSHVQSMASLHSSLPPRQSPQTYARLSNSMPQHTSSRLREAPIHSPSTQRQMMPVTQPPPPPNDRVPPIHHPQVLPPQRAPPLDSKSAPYSSVQHREPRGPSPYARATSQYDRHPTLPQRKYDPQQAYPGYRPTPAAPHSGQSQRVEDHHRVQYNHPPASVGAARPHYPPRPLDRGPMLPSQQHYHLEAARHSHELARRDYMSRTADTRSNYQYPTPSTSAVRYAPSATSAAIVPVPVVQDSTTLPSRATQRAAAAPKSNYEYQQSNHVQTSPVRSSVKPGCPNQQARMTVSVTTLVSQMNQTKQKRESPLDLSVKTVKNSADSSTTQDDVVDSVTVESKTITFPQRPTTSSRHIPPTALSVESHKVDFAPDFTQYRERSTSQSLSSHVRPGHHSVRYNEAYEPHRPAEPYPIEPHHHVHPERSKYSAIPGRPEYVPRIDLTKPAGNEHRPDQRIRDDRHFVIEERKRPSGPISNNIPEKIVRYETWSADSRIARDKLSQSMREQQELMSRPVYSYSSHKQFEAYQNEQKRAASSSAYRDHYSPTNHRYSYSTEALSRARSEYHTHYDRSPSSSSRHVIQKIPTHRDIPPHHMDQHSGVPADKRVLSILRNSLETKQTYVEPAKQAKQIPDLIVIDDIDDDIEITDLTKDSELEMRKKQLNIVNSQKSPNFGHHIQMPKAVDSLPRDCDSDYDRNEKTDPKSKSPENDVASRIRTKGELKSLPPSQDHTNLRTETKKEEVKLTPKSQKQHLFNQIRQDSLRFDSVINSESRSETIIPEVKAEPMNIDEIEKDAEVPIKTENLLEHLEAENSDTLTKEEDLDWAFACDSFMEQLKSGCHKKKALRKRAETIEFDNENNSEKLSTLDASVKISENIAPVSSSAEGASNDVTNIVIKQEPMDEDQIKNPECKILESEIKDALGSFNDINFETTKSSTNLESSTGNSIENQTIKKELDPDLTDIEDDAVTKPSQSEPEKTDIEDEAVTKPSQSAPEKDETNVKNSSLINKSKVKNVKDGHKFKKSSTSLLLDDDKEKRQSKIKRFSTSKESGAKESLRNKTLQEPVKGMNKIEKLKNKKTNKVNDKSNKQKIATKTSVQPDKTVAVTTEEQKEKEPIKTVIKEELESTDDDEPLIKSKIMKEKEIKYQLLKDLSEKSAYVKLECFDVDMNKNTRISIDSVTKDKDDKQKCKSAKVTPRSKGKSLSIDNTKNEIQNDGSSSSSDDDIRFASRLRVRKNIKSEDGKSTAANKTSPKSSPKKQDNSSTSNSSTPIRKAGFGDGSDFRPGWEEELYRYKRSLRMPTRLIAIPQGRSGGPFPRGSGSFFSRGSTSLPDLDPAPLSPAPSLAPSAATDDIYARRADKLALDSDLDSNSSCSAVNRLQYDSEASTSTVFSSSNMKKKSSSIVDVLIQKCGKKDDSKKKLKDKEEKSPKIIPKSTNPNELLPTPSLGLFKNGNKGSLSAKKEKLMEDIFYLGAFRKETVSAFRNAFINNTDGLIGATEEFAPVVLKSRTRTESRVLKQRATIKEVFGDERSASAPPICRNEDEQDLKEQAAKDIKKEPQPKQKVKPKKIVKDKDLRRSTSIRDGLRSTKSLKRNDAKGRMLRLKKRNSLIKSLNNKRIKDIANNRVKKDKAENGEKPKDKDKPKDESSTMSTGESNTKKRFKRLFGRRKFSSGFDYIRKKKKIIRRDETPNNRTRRPAVKPTPESVHDIQKEIKGWFINKSIGETHLHRAARLGYTDCVAYCLEKMEADPSAKDNAGFTPLHFAASKGHVRIARLLLQYGANVSAAAQGGIRPLHEACENSHVEVIRLLLAYGADPLLGTYAGQTPEELTEGPAAMLLRLHIADVQGLATEPWRFPPPTEVTDHEELGCNPLSSPPPSSPPPAPDATVEIQCTDAPLPPFYSLKAGPGQSADGLWCLLQDITSLLQIKSKDSLLKQIHCGSGSPKELLREIRTQEFLERAQCHQLLGAGEKVNVRASKVALVRVTDKLRQLLKIETVLVS